MTHIIEIERANGGISQIALTEVETGLRELLPALRTIVITDRNVYREYAHIIDRYEHIVIGTGEKAKTLDTAAEIYRRLSDMNVDRGCFLLGFGGGIVTDITGFVSATFLRGLRFGFVASTLMAQVDASIGGKNGVNLDGYKNIIGTFSQPDFVICDQTLLKTLPQREFRAGLAEMIKTAIIGDPRLLDMIERFNPDDIDFENYTLPQMIERVILVKAAIVGRDEFDRGERRKLNLGHTFAHAIEKCDDSCNHGEAVSIGICMAAGIAVGKGVMTPGDANRIGNTISAAGLPSRTNIDNCLLLEAIGRDKKVSGDTIHFILPTGIGSCEVAEMSIEEIGELIGARKK